jgi:hypothetical protein
MQKSPLFFRILNSSNISISQISNEPALTEVTLGLLTKATVPLALAISILALVGCTGGAGETAKVSITLPVLSSAKSSAVSSRQPVLAANSNSIAQGVSSQGIIKVAGANWNPNLSLTAISDVNCYAVFVGGPEPELNRNKCYSNSIKTSVVASFGPNVPFMPQGSTISLDVPSGLNRRIYVVGFNANPISSCRGSQTSAADFTNISPPQIISSQTVNLKPGNNNISMFVSLTGATAIDSCDIVDTRPAPIFGSGSDGNLVISGTVGHDGDTTLSSGRIFSSQTRLSAVSDLGRTISVLDSSGFFAGDEVMWMVMAAGTTSGLSSDAQKICGGGVSNALMPGKFGFSRAASVSAGTLNLEIPLPGGVFASSAALTQTATYENAASNFCDLRIVRVPHLKNLTVSSGTAFSARSFAYGSPGGILVMRVSETLSVEGSIDASGKGFPSTSAGWSGGGLFGKGASGQSVATFSGGGGSATSGGGGSNFGGGGTSNSAFGGFDRLLCGLLGTSICSPSQVALMGGSGGGSSSGMGGFGGGTIMIFAKSITGANGFIKADGLDGSNGTGGGAGGGAGGSISIVTDSFVPTNLVAKAKGGVGGNGSSGTGGGGGGGGAVEVQYCSNSIFPGTSTAMVDGGAAGTSMSGSTNAGGTGRLVNIPKPELCGAI